MIVYPALDLLDRKVVKLDATHKAPEKVYGTPVEVAERWIAAGATWLHIVDLDGAFGTGSNDVPIIQTIPRCHANGVHVQVGGGIRDERRLRLFTEGKYAADRIVVGTRAVTDPDWLAKMAAAHPHRLVVAVDASGFDVLIEGWQRTAGIDVRDFVRAASVHPVAGFLYTNVRVEGRGAGMEWDPVEAVVEASPRPVTFSGGITSLEDVRKLRELGADGAIIGSALYAGRFTFEEAREAAQS
ncbi:MAG: 1-(5-phosphoribosyl)-5-[(5-phosphoribosylamino)methylideneamino] imidazole-4-carboxamide isomerase [Planctomycetes bacterium]|nr:1-(5-phosphoribosyl)-5-[(5-phosphoribosylamino)methylideneamino] imidazole-4-carboxamide isomerase [Planctomycetota bacterium]